MSKWNDGFDEYYGDAGQAGDASDVSFGATATNFNAQNLSPGQIYKMVQGLPQTVGGIPGVGPLVNLVPGLGKTPIPGLSSLPKLLAPLNNLRGLAGFFEKGEFSSTGYAADLNAHHPKLKFLFKVGFKGFGVRNFYYFVHRCDKPKVKFNHVDVNYYNFRSRVLTSVTYEPLTMTFLDEIGNSVNDFFANYLSRRSGTGNGNYGIDKGFGPASSSRPYENGYSSGLKNLSTGTTSPTEITVEQIFANGLYANRFIFSNPRIEAFDFDELAMEESAGSLLTCTFTYDAIRLESVGGENSREVPLYTWGQTDLKRGGGTSGPENAGATSATEAGIFPATAAAGGMPGGSELTDHTEDSYDAATHGYQAENEINSSSLSSAGEHGTDPSTWGTQTPMEQKIEGSAGDIAAGRNQAWEGSDMPDLNRLAARSTGAGEFITTQLTEQDDAVLIPEDNTMNAITLRGGATPLSMTNASPPIISLKNLKTGIPGVPILTPKYRDSTV